MIKLPIHYCMRIPSQTDNLEIIRNFVSGVARKVGFDDSDISKIELSVDEACTNVIEHAYSRQGQKNIDIAVKIDYRKFTVIITDRGKAFNFNAVEVPDMKTYLAELRVGGLGIYLMKTLMDEVEYHSTPGRKNEVRMVKYFLEKSGESRKPTRGAAR
jgi:serine/threonine-protein kinase RsbW